MKTNGASDGAAGDPGETLSEMVNHLIPLLLVLSSFSVKSFITRWRLIHTQLSHLHSSLSSLSPSLYRPHPLFIHLIPNLHSTLHSLRSLSSRCSSLPPPSKLLLQSDLHIASSSLSLHLHHLDLLSSALLLSPSLNDDNTTNAAAIVLPLPTSASSPSDLLLFIRDAFARIEIAPFDLKQQALHSLLHLLSSDPPAISSHFISHLSPLIRLLDSLTPSPILHHAAAVLSLLSTASPSSRSALLDEGALGPLLRLLHSSSALLRQHAATAIHAITSDPADAWAVSAYGGVSVLIDACRPGAGGSPSVRALAAGSLKNLAAVRVLRSAMVDEGALPLLIDLVASSDNEPARKSAAVCLWSLASEGEDEIKCMIFAQGGLRRLVQMVEESSDLEILEHGLRAIQSMASHPSAARSLSSARPFFSQLAELIKIGNVSIQQISAALVSSLSPSEEIRRSMAGCMSALVKMLEVPKPAGAQEAAAEALVCLLEVRSNRVELGKDGKSMMKLVQMLDPKREEICKRVIVSVVLAVAASGSCRKRLSELGACHQLRKLVEVDVPCAKRALQKIAGNRLKNLFSLSWRE